MTALTFTFPCPVRIASGTSLVRRLFAFCATVLLFTGLTSATLVAATEVTQLRCEYRTALLGLDVAQPRLNWLNSSTERGARQTAYQILVASTPEKLAKNQGDRWDTGQVGSDQQNQIVYNGQPLTSGSAYYW